MLVAFFWLGISFLLAAVAAGLLNAVVEIDRGRWLAEHLALVGGVSMLVLGAAQFFAGAFLATGPPPRSLVRAQLALWSGGTLAVAAGVVAAAEPVTRVGAAALLAALALFAVGLVGLRRNSLQQAPWAVRWYLTAACFLAPGIAAGTALAAGSVWPHGDLLSAHLALNVAGWLGCAIVGTLHTFYPSLTGTQLRFPRLERVTYGSWVAGVAAMAIGYGFSLERLAEAGWAGLALGATLLGANIAASAHAGRELSLSARLVGAAQLCLIAGLLASLAGVLSTPGALLIGSERAAAAVLLLAGWVGLTVLGSLLHLLSVLRQVRSLPRSSPIPPGVLDRYLAPVALFGVAALAVAQLADLGALAEAGAAAVLAVYAVAGARVLALAVGALRAAPLRI